MKIVTDALEQVGLEGQLIEEIFNTGRFLKVREGQPLIEPGMEAKEMPLVINGTLRVMREDKEGREIFLYYLEGGDACAMSISCCLGTQISEFKVVAEEDATL